MLLVGRTAASQRRIEPLRVPSWVAPCRSTPSDASENFTRFYQVDGDYFVLRYSEAITFNVQDIKLTSDTNVLPASEDGSNTSLTAENEAETKAC
jgi:hypothetical protein